MIRAIWVNEELLIRKRLDGHWERMYKKEFMKRYGNDIKKKTLETPYRNQSGYDEDYQIAKGKIFSPNEDFNIDIALDRLNHKKNKRGKKVKEKYSITREALLNMIKREDGLHHYFYPKQIQQIKNGNY